MSKLPHDSVTPELSTIDAAELSSVTGGVTSAATDSSSTIEAALTSLLSSIQGLATSQQSSGGMSDMMPMMMTMNHGSSAPAAAETPVGQVTPNGWTRVS